MKRGINVFVIFALLVMSSCGIFKHRVVDNVKKSGETTLHVDSSTVSKTTTHDKSSVIVLEKAKGVAIAPAAKTELKSDLSSLLAGLKIVRDSGLFRIVQTYDSLSHTINTQINVAPQAVDYDIDKTTITKNNIQSNTESNKSVKKDSTTKFNDQSKHTDSKPGGTSYLLISGIIIVLGVALYFLFGRKLV